MPWRGNKTLDPTLTFPKNVNCYPVMITVYHITCHQYVIKTKSKVGDGGQTILRRGLFSVGIKVNVPAMRLAIALNSTQANYC